MRAISINIPPQVLAIQQQSVDQNDKTVDTIYKKYGKKKIGTYLEVENQAEDACKEVDDFFSAVRWGFPSVKERIIAQKRLVTIGQEDKELEKAYNVLQNQAERFLMQAKAIQNCTKKPFSENLINKHKARLLVAEMYNEVRSLQAINEKILSARKTLQIAAVIFENKLKAEE